MYEEKTSGATKEETCETLKKPGDKCCIETSYAEKDSDAEDSTVDEDTAAITIYIGHAKCTLAVVHCV